ncbi:hypothetical protein [Nocardioides zhouii]|nr:hypothetical protein [Nocardioides zhouii]
MTTTPFEPNPDPEIVPSGDPQVNPIDPGVIPDPGLPDTQPDGAP